MGISAKNPRWADENTCIHQIAEWICRTAVIDGADIGWAGLHFWDNGYWSLKPCGMYLYDGIAGIVLFLAKISGPVSGFVMQARRGKKSINWLLKN